MRKSKNIFNNNISPQNLMQQEGYRQFKIGNRSITSNWLIGVQKHQYQKYILSTLYLSQLEKQLYQLKQSDPNMMKQSNLFKIGNIKKKINNFALVEQNKQKPLGEQSLVNNEPPDTSNLIIQKQVGFFKTLVERKCKIQNKTLLIQSKKDIQNPYIKVDIQKYTIQLQSKDRPLGKEEFKQYQWNRDFQYRILLSGQNMKQYVIYGNIQELQKLQRYFQVQNIEVKKLGVFTKLDNQFQQKIITLFGNKIRFFDHNLRIRKAEKQQQDSIIHVNQSMQYKRQDTARFIHQNISSQYGKSQKNKSSELAISGKLQKSSLDMLSENKLVKPIEIMQQIINLQMKKEPSNQGHTFFFNKAKQKKDNAAIFKLKINKSVVFYDELDQGFDFEDNQKIEINDFELNLKDEIGISDVDEQSSNKNSLNKTNSVKKKIFHMQLKNSLDESQKFNINIHEVNSNYSTDKKNSVFNRDNRAYHKKEQQDEMDPQRNSQSSLKSLNLSYITQPQHDKEYKEINRSNTADIIQIVSRMQQQTEENDHFKYENLGFKTHKQQFMIKNQFPKKKQQIEIVKNIKNPTIHYALQQIQMLIPYYKQTIKFQILQIDLNLEIQNKLVVIGHTKGQMIQQIQKEKQKDLQKYTLYSIQGGHHFKFSQQSDQFIFVLQEESKSYYIKFSIDPKPKYQRNCSQLLIKQIDKDGQPFACSLGLFSSPKQILLQPPLTTIQFMLKYLNSGEDYNFKKDFIDDKKRKFLVKRQWNKKVLDSIIKQGNSDNFAKAVFLGMPDSLFKKMKKKVQYNPKKLFDYNERQYRMMEQNIFSVGVMDLRSFMKPSLLIKHITQALYNDYFRQRLQQLYVYFLNRYGSTRNYALIFVKEVVSKIQPIIIYGRKEKDVFDIVDLYFQVQYEIDELFSEMSKYFQKE